MNEKLDYKQSINKLRCIFNEVDPESLNPGESDGTPEDEYDDEIVKVYNFILHNMEEIKLNNTLLVDEINKIWTEYFGSECSSAGGIANRIITELF